MLSLRAVICHFKFITPDGGIDERLNAKIVSNDKTKAACGEHSAHAATLGRTVLALMPSWLKAARGVAAARISLETRVITSARRRQPVNNLPCRLQGSGGQSHRYQKKGR
jgi:hypothetical protein